MFVVFSWELAQIPRSNPESMFLEEMNEVDIGGVFETKQESNTPVWERDVKEICKKLFTVTPPSDELLNKMLKDVYFHRVLYPDVADFANLEMRLLWYKMHLAEDISCRQKREWKEMLIHLARVAHKNYLKSSQSYIQIYITKWMPEKTLSHYTNLEILKYDAKFLSIEDIKKLEKFFSY